jgi:hypothetical protein
MLAMQAEKGLDAGAAPLRKKVQHRVLTLLRERVTMAFSIQGGIP